MPLVTLESLGIKPDLLVEVADDVQGSTTVKRKVEVVELKYSPRFKSVHIEVSVQPFAANADGTYGERLPFAAIPAYMIANNEVIVDFATGDVLGERYQLLKETFDGQKMVVTEDPSLAGINYGGEYDFFKVMATQNPVIVDDLIKAKIFRKYGAPAA